mgnify:CR=1 FL=1
MEYNVVIIREAEQDMEDIYNYIALVLTDEFMEWIESF